MNSSVRIQTHAYVSQVFLGLFKTHFINLVKNCLHNNEVNNIAECNLLHDIINPTKRVKYINSHYSPILHVCMNIRKGKAKC